MPGADTLDIAIASKAFGTRPVLRDIRLELRPGERVAILAPSGTGKTTLLRIALGLDTDFDGQVTRPAGRVAAVFQEPRLLPWLDVAGNIRLVAPELTDAALTDLLSLVALPGSAATLPRALSLGMARRVALARALAVKPALLVLDEAFASLDPALAASLARTLIAATSDPAPILLLTTHDLDQALALADRVLVLAGAPATLAEDLAVPDAAARPALAAWLRQRFAFLSATAEGK